MDVKLHLYGSGGFSQVKKGEEIPGRGVVQVKALNWMRKRKLESGVYYSVIYESKKLGEPRCLN